MGALWGSSVVECGDSGVAQWESAEIAGSSVVEGKGRGLAQCFSVGLATVSAWV